MQTIHILLLALTCICMTPVASEAHPHPIYEFTQPQVPATDPPPSMIHGGCPVCSYRGVQCISYEGRGWMFAEDDQFANPPIDPAEFEWIWP